MQAEIILTPLFGGFPGHVTQSEKRLKVGIWFYCVGFPNISELYESSKVSLAERNVSTNRDSIC
jgi:hypothetical protein